MGTTGTHFSLTTRHIPLRNKYILAHFQYPRMPPAAALHTAADRRRQYWPFAGDSLPAVRRQHVRRSTDRYAFRLSRELFALLDLRREPSDSVHLSSGDAEFRSGDARLCDGRIVSVRRCGNDDHNGSNNGGNDGWNDGSDDRRDNCY